MDKEIDREHQKRIAIVVDYILQNINRDISLKTLAEVAHYSPFHFQKLFKKVLGETPKQYIIKVRLETTLLFLVIHPFKSLKEIAMDGGFSSPAVFSRAVKNYFGISAEEIRAKSPEERMRLFTNKKSGSISHIPTGPENVPNKPDIQIKKLAAVTGFYLTAPCDDPVKIQQSFRELVQVAMANDLLIDYSKIYGILNPHQGNMYKTVLAIDRDQQLPKKFNITQIPAGRYATFKICGGIKETINAGHYLYHEWLPANGYKIAGIHRLELFSGNPAITPYLELIREIYLPVEPA
jgi:AraC family transcriptional regulator